MPGLPGQYFAMDIVDSVFIRKSHRRLGLASQLLSKVVLGSDQDIGFSNPLSNGMKSVIITFLSKHPEKRDNLWLCDDNGETSCKKNIWLLKNFI